MLVRSAATAALALLIVMGSEVRSSAAKDNPVIEEMLGILKERGLIDESQYSHLRTKNTAYEQASKSLLGRIALSGSFRARHESTWYDHESGGSDNRYRLRYRIRLNGKAKVNERITAGFGIATGSDNDGSNQTLGGGANGFDPHSLFIRRAYIKASVLPFNGTLTFGKFGNPFRWKIGQDFLWDNDLTPEGLALSFRGAPYENLSSFLNLGYFILDENPKNKDPKMVAAQLGGELSLNDELSLGGRGSFYSVSSINDNLINASLVEGSLGIIGDLPNGVVGDDNRIIIGELSAYLKWKAITDWPALFHGTFARNFEAESINNPGLGIDVDDEDIAFGIGFEIGSKNKFAKLGFAYWSIEANALPPQFMVDSDLFDGKTNREGFVLYGSKRILKDTDLNLTLFVGDEIEDDVAFASSVAKADRVRLHADLAVQF